MGSCGILDCEIQIDHTHDAVTFEPLNLVRQPSWYDQKLYRRTRIEEMVKAILKGGGLMTEYECVLLATNLIDRIDAIDREGTK